MLFPRRLIALFFSSVLALSSFAQTATPVIPTGSPITLDEAIQSALAKNFAIKVSSFDTEIADARLTEAYGKFDPSLNGSYGYSENFAPNLSDSNGFRPAPDFSKADTAELGLGGLLPWGMSYRLGVDGVNARGSYNSNADNFDTFAGVSATQPLLRNFGPNPTLASIRIAQTNHGISQWQYRQDVIDVITQVIFSYNDLISTYANYRSAVRSQEFAESLVVENQKRFKVGSISEYEVTTAQSNAARSAERVFLVERIVREAENAFKQLIMDDNTPGLLKQRVSVAPPPPPPVVVVDPAADFQIALQKRPDYQQAKLGLKRDVISRRFQRNQLLPRVDLVGSYGYNGYDTDLATSRHQIRNEDYHAYSWGVVVSVPLTFTTERGRYRAAKLQERQSETQLARLEQDIVVDVGNSATQIELAEKRMRATRRSRELAQATLDAEEKRLRAGTGSTFVVTQQQQALAVAEVSEANARSDYSKALADYDRQIGVTLEKRNITIEPVKQ